MALTQTQVSELYVTLFGRSAEGDGNIYWQSSEDQSTAADAMLETDAAKEYFGDALDSDQAYIEHIYLNTLNKTYAEDTEGVDYWVEQLAAGASRGEVAAGLIEAVYTYEESTDPLTAAAYNQFVNRVEVSDYSADTIPGTGLDASNEEHMAPFVASNDSTTDDAATVDAAKADIDAYEAPDVPSVPGETFTLTTGADLVDGTADDDQINGLVSTNPINGDNQDTFSTIDTISGGAGNDTLTAQALGGTYGAKIDSVETIGLTAFGTTTLNLANAAGVVTVQNAGSIAQTTLSNSSTMFDLEVNNVTNQTTTVAYAAAATAGAEDMQKLSVNASTNDNAGVISNVSFSDAAIETIAITASGENTLRLEDATTATKTLTIDGAGDLNVRFSDDSSADADSVILKTIDASTATGNLTIDADAEFGVLKQTITTGTGDDKVTIGNVTKDDIIDLGAGADTLKTVFTANTVISTGPAFTNVETLAVSTSAGVSASIKLDKAESLTKLSLGVNGGGDSVTVTKAAAGLNTVSYNGGGATTADVALDTLTFSYAVSTGKTDALTLDFMNVDANGNVIVPDAGTQLSAGVTANGIENFTVNTAQLGADTATTTPATSDGGLALDFMSTNAMQSLTLVSETLLDLNNTPLDGMVNTIDGSAANGGVLLDLSLVTDESVTTFADKALAITTGSGDDVLTGLFTGGAEVHAATVSLGAGNDSLTVAGPVGDQAGSVDTLTIDAGAGNDTITLGNVTVATEATVSVTLGDGVDTLAVLGNATQSGITVTDFVAGAGGDKLDFTALALAVTGGGSVTDYAEVANGTDYTAATIGGMTVYTANDLTDMSAASMAVAAAAPAAAGTGQELVHTSGDDYIVAASDGTDTGIFIINDGGDGVVDAGEATLLVTLSGIEDTSALTVDNFTDFLA